MAQNVLDTLKERGFVKQITFEEDLYKLLGSEKVPFYVGFDPTADSLHVGHFLVLMAMAHMQRAGHKPICLIGGGTAFVGDPSGRSDMRSMMTKDTIRHNVECFKKQISKFIDFSDDKAIMVDNGDWLLNLNFVEFMRDIGVYFSVNRMITFECFKKRMEKGLTFLEFSYMLMQSYDFLMLYQKYGCKLELGGDDQWANMLGGADLIRRKEQQDAFAMTFTLLTKSDGTKMGKTAGGAVWLSAEKTSPYDFYQYWRNVDDADVEKCLKLLTFMPIDEINELCQFKDERINKAKERLAFEVTKIVHNEEEAIKAQNAAKAAFGGGNGSDMIAMELTKEQVSVRVTELLVTANITKSIGEGRRLIEGGAVSIDEEKITDVNATVPQSAIEKGEFILHKGKKVHQKILVL
ncbi:MAG: tyrosine--tRNA ligase [Clostridiales bacterium]|nr:tyrosine--tRNA ligase [Clostridiales bacterium]